MRSGSAATDQSPAKVEILPNEMALDKPQPHTGPPSRVVVGPVYIGIRYVYVIWIMSEAGKCGT